MAFNKLGLGGSEQNNDDLAEINIIPLVDVMLVLLIIFMVAAPLSITGMKVELPVSRSTGVKVQEERTVLTIDAKGDYFIDRVNIKSAQLLTKLKAIFEFKERKELYIRADKRVPYGKVIDAMSSAKQAGINRLAMLTTPPKKKGKAKSK